jgi:hypothetical protein
MFVFRRCRGRNAARPCPGMSNSIPSIELRVDKLTALLVSEIAKSDKFLSGLSHQLGELQAGDPMPSMTKANAYLEAAPGMTRILRKLDFDVLFPAAQFKQETRHHRVRDIDDLLDSRRFGGNASKTAHDG